MAEYISPHDVISYVRTLEESAKESFDCDHKRLAAAIAILMRLLGHEWVDSRILSSRSKDRNFVRPEGKDPFDDFKAGDRTITLAEHLLNLQQVRDFEYCLGELRNAKAFEPEFGKIVAAGMLHRRKIPFHFVVASGQKGHDYDAEAIIEGTAVPIELKTKIEGNAVSMNSVRNSLRDARKQLPGGTPSLVFLRVPESWAITDAVRLQIIAAIHKEFRDSGTIGIVVVHYERWYKLSEQPNGAERRSRSIVVSNGRAHEYLAALEDAIIAVPGRPEEVPWLTFNQLLCGDTLPPRQKQNNPAHHNLSSGLQDLNDLTIIGPVSLMYAHLCDKGGQVEGQMTWLRVRQRIKLANDAKELPAELQLVFMLEGHGRYKPGKRLLQLFFLEHEGASPAIVTEHEIDFVQASEGAARVIVYCALELGPVPIAGPGIYYFDFVLDKQYVGRLPFIVFFDPLPAGVVHRGLLRSSRIALEFGHLVRRFEPPTPGDPEEAIGIYDVVDILDIHEAAPFQLVGLSLVVGFSAPGDSAYTYRISAQLLDEQDKALHEPAEVDALFYPLLPGMLYKGYVFFLNNVVCPGPGTYKFQVMADGNAVGEVRFAALVQRGDHQGPR